MAPSILVIGSLNTDLVTRTPRVPSAGETLTAQSFSTGHGGKGANQAVACARLSRTASTLDSPTVRVRMAGAVGADDFGTSMIAALAASGIETDQVRAVEGEVTGTAVILVETDSGENRILLSPGANHSLRPELFARGLPAPKPDLVILQLEIPLDTTVAVLRAAKEEGVPVLWNPAPAVPLEGELLGLVGHLIVNETEAAILSRKEEKDLDLESEGGLAKVADHFLQLGVKTVLITLGAKGVFYATNAASSSKTSGLVPARKVKVVDTTAAGDTFVGAYAVALLSGATVSDAVERANRAAAVSVGRVGAQASIPWMDEVDVV